METLRMSILINADRKKVWDTMLGDKGYREWTRAFNEGSFYQGSWDKGSEIRFLALDDKGETGGMFSRIKENIRHQFISIEHMGIISKGIVDTTGEEAKKWAPSYENYTFKEENGRTELIIEVQVADGYRDMFEEMWPRALQALKTLCEK